MPKEKTQKTKKKSKKHPGGRPSVMTKEVIAKLEDEFAHGSTDLEACFMAGISKDALYNYEKKHPEFKERKEALKSMVKRQAKRNVAVAINNKDLQQSNYYLDRKAKDEGYTTKSTIEHDASDELKQIMAKVNQIIPN